MSDLNPQGTPQGAPVPAPAPDPAPAPQPSAVEARLAELLGGQQALAQKVQTQESVTEEMRSLFAGLVQKLDSVTSAIRPTAPGVAPRPDPSTAGGDLRSQVQAAVQDVLGPILQQTTAANEKAAKHKQAFDRVVQTYPELADRTTRDSQLFHQIYNGREDLRALDDAPSLIAEAVRGLRSLERVAERDDQERRTRATLPATAGRKVSVFQSAGGQDATVQQLKEQYTKLVEKGKRIPLTRREWGDYVNLTVALKHAGSI